MEQKKNEKLQQLLNDEVFIAVLKNLNTEEEFQEALANNGVVMTDEEVREFLDQVDAALSEAELVEGQLENVSGGFTLVGVGLCVGVYAISYGVGYLLGRRLKKKGNCSKPY